MMVLGSHPWRGADTACEQNLPPPQPLAPPRTPPSPGYLEVDAEQPGEPGLGGAAGQRAQDHAGGTVLSPGRGERSRSDPTLDFQPQKRTLGFGVPAAAPAAHTNPATLSPQ